MNNKKILLLALMIILIIIISVIFLFPNNSGKISDKIYTYENIKVSNITYSPKEVTIGDTIYINVTIENLEDDYQAWIKEFGYCDDIMYTGGGGRSMQNSGGDFYEASIIVMPVRYNYEKTCTGDSSWRYQIVIYKLKSVEENGEITMEHDFIVIETDPIIIDI